MNETGAVFDMRTGQVRCEYCGQRYAVTLPCSVDIFAAIVRAFEKQHRRCGRKPSTPPASKPPQAQEPKP